MVLTEEEKLERHRLANQRYYQKQKEKANKGDAMAKKQLERNKYNTAFSHTKSFINKQAKKKDLLVLRDLIATRQKKFKKLLY